MAIKQTAGRDALGEFAPKFAELNDDVLFGQVWSREDKLSLRDRSVVTVTALMAQGLVDYFFRYHLESARENGITREEIAEALVQGLGGIYYGQRSLEGRGIKRLCPQGRRQGDSTQGGRAAGRHAEAGFRPGFLLADDF